MRHSNPKFAAIAERHTILRTQVGSGVHGTAIAGTDDRDEMGMCVEPREYMIGMSQFEQYIFRSATERTGDPNEPSRAGDLDLVVYSLRKWLRLALQGNPSVLIPLFVPDDEVVTITELGRDLRAQPDLIVSREAGHRFVGYLRSQRTRMLEGKVTGRVSRPELIAEFGFDTKYAGHMVRLGLQGVELLETGRITLPIPEPSRSWIRDLRQGKHTQQEAIAAAKFLEARLLQLIDGADLPPRPDYARANRWLIGAYESAWAAA
jgi:hypothetical protein